MENTQNVESTQNIEKFMGMQLMTQIMKKSLGDSMGFAMIMESLLKAASEDKNNDLLKSLGIGEQDLSQLGYGGGTPLDFFENPQSVTEIMNKELKSDNITIEEAINRTANKYGVDSKLIRAIIKQESDFNPYSKSWAGAMGLMQLMPENVIEDGVKNPYDIEENIDAGTRQFKRYLNKYNNVQMALAAYNAGPGTLARRGVKNTEEISKLPSETRNYVKKVMAYYGK